MGVKMGNTNSWSAVGPSSTRGRAAFFFFFISCNSFILFYLRKSFDQRHFFFFFFFLMSDCTVESCKVDTSDGLKLHVRFFKPPGEAIHVDLAVVLVHPYTILGGCQGYLRGIATGLAERGCRAVTFDMRGSGKSSGKASITGFAEIKDVVAVCKWVSENLSVDRIVVVGSSAGAPIAGSSVGQIEQVVGYVSLGYPFGMAASVLFGRHHKAILEYSKPKLFVMGTRDGFTSVKQLKNKLSCAVGRVEMHLIDGASHFQMEGPEFDAQMVNLILEFVSSL